MRSFVLIAILSLGLVTSMVVTAQENICGEENECVEGAAEAIVIPPAKINAKTAKDKEQDARLAALEAKEAQLEAQFAQLRIDNQGPPGPPGATGPTGPTGYLGAVGPTGACSTR
jgi:hypothetical protein